MDLSILKDIDDVYKSLSDEYVEQVGRISLRPEEAEEKPLGVVHNIDVRRMWAAAFHFEQHGAELAVRGKFQTFSESDREQLQEQVNRAHTLEQLCRQIFWAQSREDSGGAVWCAKHIGIRAGWMLVISACDCGPPDIRKLLGGIFGAAPED